MSDSGNHLVVEPVEQLGAAFRRIGPRAVGVRIVALPTDVVDVELVEQLHTDAIGDETAQDAFANSSVGDSPCGRSWRIRRCGARSARHRKYGIQPMSLGQRKPQLREAMPERGPQEVPSV
jgi:hypothetical protein